MSRPEIRSFAFLDEFECSSHRGFEFRQQIDLFPRVKPTKVSVNMTVVKERRFEYIQRPQLRETEIGTKSKRRVPRRIRKAGMQSGHCQRLDLLSHSLLRTQCPITALEAVDGFVVRIARARQVNSRFGVKSLRFCQTPHSLDSLASQCHSRMPWRLVECGAETAYQPIQVNRTQDGFRIRFHWEYIAELELTHRKS